MRLPSPIVAGSIAIGVFAAGFAVGHFANQDNGSAAKGTVKPQVLGQVFDRNPAQGSTTTTGGAAAGPEASSASAPASKAAQPSAGAQSSAAPAPAAQQTTSTSPPVTTVVVVANPNCGSGTASAKVGAQTFPRQETANTDYETDVTASVTDGVNKPIQIDSLTVRLFYDDGGVGDLIFNQAIGNVVQPGTADNYTVKLDTGQRQVHTVAMQSFSFHTAGHPECAGGPA
ncbi:MAG: hypothetical protein JO085_01260 [Acidimicrobiia bacterium]|nr:hypothetical protein [Acidimicrobiia bacterium]